MAALSRYLPNTLVFTPPSDWSHNYGPTAVVGNLIFIAQRSSKLGSGVCLSAPVKSPRTGPPAAFNLHYMQRVGVAYKLLTLNKVRGA